jgi:hypothetical protein
MKEKRYERAHVSQPGTNRTKRGYGKERGRIPIACADAWRQKRDTAEEKQEQLGRLT